MVLPLERYYNSWQSIRIVHFFYPAVKAPSFARMTGSDYLAIKAQQLGLSPCAVKAQQCFGL